MNVNDIKGRLKQWGEDGYIDADLRSVFNDALATIKELEGKLKKADDVFTETFDLMQGHLLDSQHFQAKVKELEELRREAFEVACSAPELNMGNYSFDDVRALNLAMTELYEMLEPPKHATKEDV